MAIILGIDPGSRVTGYGVIVWAFFRCSGGGTGLCASHVKL